MAYQKLLIDNPVCSRRFHLTFDDTAPKVPHVKITCNHCDAVVFAADDHPPVRLARDENLIKTTELSKHLARECHFEDRFEKIKVIKPAEAPKAGSAKPSH